MYHMVYMYAVTSIELNTYGQKLEFSGSVYECSKPVFHDMIQK